MSGSLTPWHVIVKTVDVAISNNVMAREDNNTFTTVYTSPELQRILEKIHPSEMSMIVSEERLRRFISDIALDESVSSFVDSIVTHILTELSEGELETLVRKSVLLKVSLHNTIFNKLAVEKLGKEYVDSQNQNQNKWATAGTLEMSSILMVVSTRLRYIFSHTSKAGFGGMYSR